MKQIKIRESEDGPWFAVEFIEDDIRPGWVKIKQENEEPKWVEEYVVHPADQVALRVERVARQRYEWVPKEDIEE
jgi:hypothetical protein